MSTNQQSVFRPVEGAILDLESLIALAGATERMLSVFAGVSWPEPTGAPPRGLVLSGLELESPPSEGQPGNVRPDRSSDGVSLSPGVALLPGRDGRMVLLEVPSAQRLAWPTQAGPAEAGGALALTARVEPEHLPAAEGRAVSAARAAVKPQLGFVKLSAIDQPHLLPLAWPVGNGRDWATDLRRVWQPDHPAIAALLKRLERIEALVWRADPEGGPWDRGVLGRNWVRYQTVACAALEAARLALLARPGSTLDRVRLLSGLLERLQGTVERAADELLQVMGGANAIGPYRDALSRARPEAS